MYMYIRMYYMYTSGIVCVYIYIYTYMSVCVSVPGNQLGSIKHTLEKYRLMVSTSLCT